MIILKNKNALIVGTKRIGQIVGMRLAEEGVNLAISYRSSKEEAEKLKEEAEKLNVKVVLVQGDVAIEADVKNMVGEATKQLDSLDFMIDLASGFEKTPLETLDGQKWEDAQKDSKGSFLLSVYASREMMKNHGQTKGHIILFSDWAATSGKSYTGYLPYLVGKAAIDYMTKVFAKELAPHGILVNAIAPGPTIKPPFLDEDYWQKEVLGKTPLKRESSKEEIGEMILTLLKSETVTGQTIMVDSGSHL